MANNNGIFNAALAGATGGVSSRSLTKPLSTDYDDIATELIAFATDVDAAIATDPELTEQQFNLMQDICMQVLSSRWLGLGDGGNLTSLVTAVVAFWTRMSAELLGETTIVVEQLNWDGTANATLIALPANHRPGQYLVFGNFVITTPDAGIADRVVTWADAETSVAQTTHSPAPISFSGGGAGELTVPAYDSPVVIFSNGLTPVQVQFQPAGAGAAFRANVYASALFIGAMA